LKALQEVEKRYIFYEIENIVSLFDQYI